MTDKTLKTDCCLLREGSFLYCFLLTSTSCIFHFKTSPKALDPKKNGHLRFESARLSTV